MNVDDWIAEVSKAYAATGSELATVKRKHLLDPLPTSKTDPSMETIREAFDVISRYFFQKALAGQSFGPVEKVTRSFGRSLEENYGLSDGPFIKMATTYWTYKLEVQELYPEHSRISLSQVLLRVEQNIASVFFPTPGPLSMPIDERRATQRELLEMYAPSMDIDRFLSESPVLAASSTRGGCSGSAAVFLAIAISAAARFLDALG